MENRMLELINEHNEMIRKNLIEAVQDHPDEPVSQVVDSVLLTEMGRTKAILHKHIDDYLTAILDLRTRVQLLEEKTNATLN